MDQAVGTLSSATVHPREIFKVAILANAAAVIVAHNHPSGDPTPSREVIELAERLAAEAIRKLTAESTVDLELPGREPCVYFAVTPDTHRAFDFVASLFFTFLIHPAGGAGRCAARRPPRRARPVSP